MHATKFDDNLISYYQYVAVGEHVFKELLVISVKFLRSFSSVLEFSWILAHITQQSHERYEDYESNHNDYSELLRW